MATYLDFVTKSKLPQNILDSLAVFIRKLCQCKESILSAIFDIGKVILRQNTTDPGIRVLIKPFQTIISYGMENAYISGTSVARFLNAYYIYSGNDDKEIFSKYVAEILGQLFRSKKNIAYDNLLTFVQALYDDLQSTKAEEIVQSTRDEEKKISRRTLLTMRANLYVQDLSEFLGRENDSKEVLELKISYC